MLLVAPYYNRPPQAGIEAHFRAVAAATDLPVMIYDVPVRTGRRVSQDVLLRLFREVPNIVAFKDATGDPPAAAALVAQAGEHFDLYSGDDACTLPLLAVGAVGVVGTSTHWTGPQFAADDRGLSGGRRRRRHARINARLLDSFDFINSEDSVFSMSIKAMLRTLGQEAGECRLPLAAHAAGSRAAGAPGLGPAERIAALPCRAVNWRPCKHTWSAARCGMPCWACPSTITTGWWSAPRPQEMITGGYLPVGKDFPVFLHPETREEYALARTERKTARGYHGFAFHAEPDVTLEQDLARRDLTINAMAQDENGRLIDPFGGRADLKSRVLRHVTHAFREDPVRILRVARFAARFADFSLAPETLALMREMVQAGEVDALVAERVWQELSRGLMEAKPSRMFEVLRECGALERLLPEVDCLWGVPQRADYHPEVDTGVHLMMVLDMSARLGCAVAGALRLPHARPGQGHDARGDTAQAHRARRAQRRSAAQESATACASRRNAASWRRWWRGSTATSTAASNSALRLWCGCSSAAMPFASPSASTRHCWPANATRAAGWAWRKSHIRSGRACWPHWLRRRPWPRMKSQRRRSKRSSRAPRSAR